jgi:hypothetical protein
MAQEHMGFLTGVASVATIAGVVIAYLAWQHPHMPQGRDGQMGVPARDQTRAEPTRQDLAATQVERRGDDSAVVGSSAPAPDQQLGASAQEARSVTTETLASGSVTLQVDQTVDLESGGIAVAPGAGLHFFRNRSGEARVIEPWGATWHFIPDQSFPGKQACEEMVASPDDAWHRFDDITMDVGTSTTGVYCYKTNSGHLGTARVAFQASALPEIRVDFVTWK